MATSFSGGRTEYPERTTDHGQATGKLYHLRLPVECTLFVIYMNLIMLGNPTTQLIDPPGPGSYGTVVVKLNIWHKNTRNHGTCCTKN